MALRTHLRGGAMLTAGGAAASGAAFLRNILVARLIGVEDFGIAATMSLTMTLLEMISALGLEQMIVQDDEGDTPSFMGSCHTFVAARGLLLGLVLFLFAEPIALLFEVPEAIWAYQLLALVPVIRGFAHYDRYRYQREMRFVRSVIVDTVPPLVTTAAVFPIAWLVDDYRLMLYLVLLQTVLLTVSSHVVASRGYRLGYDWALIKKMLVFGWPLLVNGCLLFGIVQGERVIVGTFYSLENLGWYSAAFTLVYMPGLVVTKVLQTFLMPLVVKTRENPERLAHRSVQAVGLCAAVGAGYAFAGWIGGGAALVLAFGEEYAEGARVIGLIAVMQGLRLTKAGIAIVAISLANTRVLMQSNIFRAGGVPVALGVAYAGHDIETVVIAGIAAEGLSFLLLAWMLRGGAAGGAWLTWVRVGAVSVAAGGAMVFAVAIGADRLELGTAGRLTVGVAGGLVCTGVCCILTAQTRDLVRRAIRER